MTELSGMDMVKIARIVGAHGVHGTLKVESLSAHPERFRQLSSVHVQKGAKMWECKVCSTGKHNDLLLLGLDGIDSREDALDLRGAYLCVPEDQVFPLPEGEYYYFQLVGLRVYDSQRGYLGDLTDILETGANDVYVVQSPQYGEILLPAIKQVIKKIDLQENTMQVDLLEGLIDDEENSIPKGDQE